MKMRRTLCNKAAPSIETKTMRENHKRKEMGDPADCFNRLPCARTVSIIQRTSRLLLMLLVVLCVSCGGKRITKANVDEVADGMSKKQVESILGPPTSVTTGFRCHEKDDLRLPTGQGVGHDRFQGRQSAVKGQHACPNRFAASVDSTSTRVPAELERKIDEAIAHYPARSASGARPCRCCICGRNISASSAMKRVHGSRRSSSCSRSISSSWSRFTRCFGGSRAGKHAHPRLPHAVLRHGRAAISCATICARRAGIDLHGSMTANGMHNPDRGQRRWQLQHRIRRMPGELRHRAGVHGRRSFARKRADRTTRPCSQVCNRNHAHPQVQPPHPLEHRLDFQEHRTRRLERRHRLLPAAMAATKS